LDWVYVVGQFISERPALSSGLGQAGKPRSFESWPGQSEDARMFAWVELLHSKMVCSTVVRLMAQVLEAWVIKLYNVI